MNDAFNLQRFVRAQDPVFEKVRSELRAGHKRGHWMWFIFPQIKGLGDSYNSNYFGITSLGEARAYLLHEALGPRLRECTGLVNAVQERTAGEIFGSPDDMKFRSSMTLFAHATADNQIFQDALKKYCGGKYDPLTLDRL